ncbi:MAG: hypothetical protein EB059_03380 [Alphaproteobacteria bacterium]|nr:hypothetical protein [Alphaproteobacteria bacterium]
MPDVKANLSAPQRARPDAGIAVGVILFALALIGAMAVAMSSGNTMVGSTITIDRIAAEVKSQGQLILAKIRQCYTSGLADKQLDCSNNTLLNDNSTPDPSDDTWSRIGCPPIVPIDTTLFYPTSTGTGTLVEALDCPSYSAGSQNLWSGQSPAMLPPPSPGLAKWTYVNAGDTGGRCIRIQPAGTADEAMKAGLAQAARAFSSGELTYTAGSTSQRFILWLTAPTGTVSANCAP